MGFWGFLTIWFQWLRIIRDQNNDFKSRKKKLYSLTHFMKLTSKTLMPNAKKTLPERKITGQSHSFSCIGSYLTAASFSLCILFFPLSSFLKQNLNPPDLNQIKAYWIQQYKKDNRPMEQSSKVRNKSTHPWLSLWSR